MRVEKGDFLLFRASRIGLPLAAASCEVLDATGEGFVFWEEGRLDCDNALRDVE